jgi:hypothetical protein
MDVQVRLAILSRRDDPYASHLMCTIDWQQHWLRRALIGPTRTNYYLTIPDAAN